MGEIGGNIAVALRLRFSPEMEKIKVQPKISLRLRAGRTSEIGRKLLIDQSK